LKNPSLASLRFVGYIDDGFHQLYHLELRNGESLRNMRQEADGREQRQSRAQPVTPEVPTEPAEGTRNCGWQRAANHGLHQLYQVRQSPKGGLRNTISRKYKLTNPARRRDFLFSPNRRLALRGGRKDAGKVRRVKKSSFLQTWRDRIF